MKIDILNREPIINDIQNILLLLSNRKRGCSFAIDGGWGVGKTYLLQELEKRIEVFQNEGTADNRFYVFHYNCWQYDYYEEPAIAIVSAMLDKILSELDKKVDSVIKGSWEYAKEILAKIAGEFIEKKIGINLVEVCDNIQDNVKNQNEGTYQFDSMFSFKKSLDFTRGQIKELATNKTVVMVVDELDRCMPSYAIKVLERLHHMFEGIDNVIVILGIDSLQLEHSIQEIYGEKVDTEHYLKKFISFRVTLDLGELQTLLFKKYEKYFSHFEYDKEVYEDIMQLISICEIDARNLDKIFEKLSLIHEIVCSIKMPASVLFYEILWGMIKYKVMQSEAIVSGNYSRFGKDLYWIPEIDHATYGGLDGCISTKLIEYLKKLKKSVEIARSVYVGNGVELKYAKNDEMGTVFYF